MVYTGATLPVTDVFKWKIINNKYIEEWNSWTQYLLWFDSDDRLNCWFWTITEVGNRLTGDGVPNLK
jgi:hypothetical protein